MPNYDLKDDTQLCPTERKALKEIYDLAKGREWTDSEHWTSEYKTCCDWHGVMCDETDQVIELTLSNNALSGKLSESIGDLRALKVLDLSDNNIKVRRQLRSYVRASILLFSLTHYTFISPHQGSIPSEIGLLSSLTTVRLSHNSFVGSAPAELGTLERLELVQLHSNRILGSISLTLRSHLLEKSSFTADCGVPSFFEEPVECDKCTMCCKNLDFMLCYFLQSSNLSNFLLISLLL